jgi:fructose-1,6-bisphosphatase
MISSVAIEIYNSLNDKRNCISKYTRIKKAVPKEFVQILQCEIIAADPNSNKGHLLKLNNDLLYDKKETIILRFQLQRLKSLSFMVQIAFIVLILLLTKDASKLVCFEKCVDAQMYLL